MGLIHRFSPSEPQTATPTFASRRAVLARMLRVCALAAPLMAAGGIWGADRAAAQERSPVVIELYTSQGCSSCPPADALMRDLAKRADVIALSLHVDYWDYIGWKDKFADPAFTARQRAYARQAKHRSIYTPQMIVGGSDHVVGTHAKDVAALIARHGAKAPALSLSAARSGARMQVSAPALRAARPMVVQVVRYTPSASVKILRGENAGKTVDYANIVTEWSRVGEWDGRAPLMMDVKIGGDAPAVVIVQEVAKRGPGAILAAARVK